jgi:hypothetical protein
MRAFAIVLLFAVLPSMELVEQVVHVVEHALHGDAPNHSAHHDAQPGDEHGCTGLVHLCASHLVQVTPSTMTPMKFVATTSVIAPAIPPQLFDKNALEPPHRPPIA